MTRPRVDYEPFSVELVESHLIAALRVAGETTAGGLRLLSGAIWQHIGNQARDAALAALLERGLVASRTDSKTRTGQTLVLYRLAGVLADHNPRDLIPVRLTPKET